MTDLEAYIAKRTRLEEYVKSFKDGPWTESPTVRMLARRFKTTQAVIVELVEDSEVLSMAVGMRCGSGVAEFDSVGDQIPEWVGE